MGRVRLLLGVPCCNSPSSHMELCPPVLLPPSSETLPTRPASLPPQGHRRTGSISCQHTVALSHAADRTISECREGIYLRRFLRDASNSKSPEIRQERKLEFPMRQLYYTLMEDSWCLGDSLSPTPPKMHLFCFDTSALGVYLQGGTHAPLWPQPCLMTLLIECVCECASVCEYVRTCVSACMCVSPTRLCENIISRTRVLFAVWLPEPSTQQTFTNMFLMNAHPASCSLYIVYCLAPKTSLQIEMAIPIIQRKTLSSKILTNEDIQCTHQVNSKSTALTLASKFTQFPTYFKSKYSLHSHCNLVLCP